MSKVIRLPAAAFSVVRTVTARSGGVASRVKDIAGRAGRLQTGYIFHYAFAMLIGVAALLTWLMFWGAPK